MGFILGLSKTCFWCVCVCTHVCVSMCMYLEVLEARRVWPPWSWSYRRLWATRCGFWKLNASSARTANALNFWVPKTYFLSPPKTEFQNTNLFCNIEHWTCLNISFLAWYGGLKKNVFCRLWYWTLDSLPGFGLGDLALLEKGLHWGWTFRFHKNHAIPNLLFLACRRCEISAWGSTHACCFASLLSWWWNPTLLEL